MEVIPIPDLSPKEYERYREIWQLPIVSVADQRYWTSRTIMKFRQATEFISCVCDPCSTFPIQALRHYCLVCPDYDTCPKCIANGSVTLDHEVTHPTLVYHRPSVRVLLKKERDEGIIVLRSLLESFETEPSSAPQSPGTKKGEEDSTTALGVLEPVDITEKEVESQVEGTVNDPQEEPKPEPDTETHEKPALAQVSVKIELTKDYSYTCHVCNSTGITGHRYVCVACYPGVTICTNCYSNKMEHATNPKTLWHFFIYFDPETYTGSITRETDSHNDDADESSDEDTPDQERQMQSRLAEMELAYKAMENRLSAIEKMLQDLPERVIAAVSTLTQPRS
jgi:hypothetical protein